MRPLTIPFLLLLATPLLAQPGELFLQDPCPLPVRHLSPLDSTRADLWLHGIVEGTEDVPSSAGHCIQAIATRPHVQVLYGFDARRNWDLLNPERHGRLQPDSLADGLANGNFRWDRGDLRVAWQGYGNFFEGNGWTQPNEAGTLRMILRVTTEEAVQLAVVQIATNQAEGFASVAVLNVVPEGDVLTW